jgi:sec-independent protein translocase protein TatA
MNLGPPELIIILVILLVLFGGRKLPELSRSIGSSIKEFRKATDEEDKKNGEDSPKVRPPANKEE